ncbi:hypothetical protein H6G54_25820 [Anabaena cylindrica FACHB-243]|uniref:hypothetical protein n=1 Tax=Anabaena TaxID=1163 RepID=UPI000BBC55EF|nr:MULTISPECIES: hypothetical protein [Anabaena]MBD2421056.1 hypothetical protein [Anabaena cylindrica FACHB-243]MCM2405809.1 hypothetical protein [Anabaena sp. CCAP 1446/1C]
MKYTPPALSRTLPLPRGGVILYLRELHKKDDPILWDGHLARPCIISGQDARTTRNFGVFF